MPRERQETLVIRGKLDRAGRFEPRRMRSTPNVREWPVVEDHDYVVELLDREDRVLHREWALVRPDVGCDPGDPQRFRLLAYIGLNPDAASVRVRRDELVLWRSEIPDAPELAVGLARGRPSREKPVTLRLRYSDARDDANVTVVYQWGPRQFQPVYVGPASPTIAVDLRDLPGGDECRLVVSYSNGLRSAGAATEPFALPRLGPTVEIVQPTRRDRPTEGIPIILEGMVTDAERLGGPQADETLVWLVDEEEVGRGPITSVDGLAAGAHNITLLYRADPGASASVDLRVRKAQTPTANDWDRWDPTDDNVSTD